MRRILVSAAILGLVLPLSATAQEARQQTVVVTGSRLSVDDLRSAPAIYRRIRADFVQVQVICQSGSRDASERRSELEKCFDALVSKAASTDGFSLEGGDIGESSAPIDSVLFGDVYSTYNNQGSFRLTLNVDTREGETFDKLMERAEAFLKSVKLSGRAESYLGTEQYLGARNMGAQRQNLLSDIAEEIQNLRGPLGASAVTATGLESRVVTQPSGPLELEIFIPYTLKVEWGEAD